MNTNSTACVQITDLLVTHQKRATLVSVPDLAVEQGTVTAILGPSGSGKSTLLRAINRLNDCWEELRTEGQVAIRVEGKMWRAYPDKKAAGALDLYPLDKLRRKAGMLFQHPHLLPLSIAGNISMPLVHGAGVSKHESEERMVKALGQVGLWDEVKDRLDVKADCLSGGQMQRLCMARILALEPDILLLDEPTASLDEKAAAKIEETIEALGKTISILLVTHNPRQADRLASAQIWMRDGELEK